jgi:outer membrane receptor protein involved in Fe transport
MRKRTYDASTLIIFLLIAICSHTALAQSSTVSGTITNKENGSGMVGASVTVKGKVIGTTTDNQGNFSLRVNQAPPFTLVFSLLGFQTQEQEINQPDVSGLKIALEEQTIFGQEVVVAASRVEETVLQSPVSVEKLDIRNIRETPSANFYDALQNVKGVEASTQSLTFKSVNTRGFNANGNVRMVQLIDGMDNQAPGLNFSVGNILGISELDLESVELLPGAASALYGPNAINGILLMNSKSPFLYQGLSAYVRGGLMQPDPTNSQYHGMGDYAIRYAKAFNNRFAFKVNASYLKALDWHASDTRDQSQGGVNLGSNNFDRLANGNPAYDGINIYGDETAINLYSSLFANGVPGNGSNGTSLFLGAIATTPIPQAGNQTLPQITGLSPQQIFGLVIPNQNVTRTGYEEKYLANYNTESLKLNGSLHYRVTDNAELILQGNYGTGTTMYTGADRYALRGFEMGQVKLELKGTNFFVRAYTTQERSGNSYIAGATGALINESWKPSEAWYAQYFGTYAQSALQTYAGAYLLALNAGQNQQQALATASGAVTASSGNFMIGARNAADQGRLLPGSAEFEAAKDRVTNGFIGKPTAELPRGGSKFLDKTNLYHVEGMYNFSKEIPFAEVIVGGNYRSYDLNSEGTLFITKPDGSEYSIWEAGGYVQLSKRILNEKLKLTASGRYDKNMNFKGQFTPRLSAVYTVANTHNFRASYQTGFRIPTTQNQYIDLLTGQVRLIGALQPLIDKYQFRTNPAFTYESVLTAQAAGNPGLLVQYNFPEYKPEQVRAVEVGYKGLFANKLFVDAYYYYNIFNNFDGGQVIVQNPGQTNQQVFSLPANYQGELKTHGWAVGANYSLPRSYELGGNVSYNALINGSELGSFVPMYNTPRYRTNVTFGNRNVVKNVGFNIAWRFQEQFRWQSTFVSNELNLAGGGYIPPYHVFDAQVSYKVPSIKSIFKIGGSNLFNRRYVQSWGNPSIGALYYVSITFDELLN